MSGMSLNSCVHSGPIEYVLYFKNMTKPSKSDYREEVDYAVSVLQIDMLHSSRLNIR